MQRTSLLDLPVLPIDRDAAVGTGRITTSFVHERKSITDAKSLKAFIERWKPIWLLQAGPYPETTENNYVNEFRGPVPEAAVMLVNHDYDADKLLESLKAEQPDTESDHFDMMCALALPAPALAAFLLSKEYMVGDDIIFVRLFLDTYPEFADEGRPFKKTEFQDSCPHCWDLMVPSEGCFICNTCGYSKG
jgi:hypothetical protein